MKNDGIARRIDVNDASSDDDSTTDELTALIHRTDYPRDTVAADRTLRNFVTFSFLFAANPCAALACLSLATARLGKIGAYSSVILYLTYTFSSVMGATYIVKELGARNAMVIGMTLYCCYVACFWIAVSYPDLATISAASGAFLGGIGAGITWTAQGSYFSSASQDHALSMGCDWTECTASFSGIFAFAYLIEETIIHVSSYFLLEWGVPWTTIFALYAIMAILSTVSMVFVKDYPHSKRFDLDSSIESQLHEVTAALDLLFRDKKMPFLIWLSAAFGLSGSFLNSFVSGEVIRIALNDQESKTVGLFVSWTAGVAAISSLVFGKITHDHGKSPVMIFGNAAFFFVAMPFIVRPNLDSWTWQLLMLVYAFQGIGRATFESAVKATFADLYPYEKEGAFANIILQNGLFGSIGYALTFSLACPVEGIHCVRYRNGTLHNVLMFEFIVCFAAVVAVGGYLQAMRIYREEQSVCLEDSELKQYKTECVTAYYRRPRSQTI